MKLPLRQELTILPADKPNKTIGFKVYEVQGVGVYNPRGIGKLGICSINIDICKYFECTQSPYMFFKAIEGTPFVFGVCSHHIERMYAKGILQYKDEYEEISYEEAVAFAVMLT